MVEELKGEFPKSAKELLVLPGVGHYTAGAVASIALNEVCNNWGDGEESLWAMWDE